MSDSRFDEVTKALATPTSRRVAFKSFAATAMGGLLALSGFGNASAHSQRVHASTHNWSVDAPASEKCPKATGCFVACENNFLCSCVSTTEGRNACVQEICTSVPCTKSNDCPHGSICFTQGCCGTGSFCVPLC